MRTRVKICGITRPADAIDAVQAGVDAIGLVFYPPSPRYVETDQAKAIVAQLPAFVTSVALFVNAEADFIKHVVNSVGIDLIQFHGDECPDYCASHGRPWIKALRMKPDLDLQKKAGEYEQARGILLDAYRPGVPGGTGERFDWDRVPASLAPRTILAGGLAPGNVTEAIKLVRPFAVDVSGGVEKEKGIKDRDKMNQFLRGVRLAED